MSHPGRLQLLVATLLCFMASTAIGQHVHTNRPRGKKLLTLPKEKDVWHFVVFGDRTSGPPEGIEVLKQAVADTNLLDPDLVMTVGDLVQGYNTTKPWLKQMREFKSAMSDLTMPWYPVAGNHDIYWRGPDRPEGEHEKSYEEHFGPLWYWFPHKNAAFVVLYTDEGNPKNGRKAFTRKGYDDMSPAQLEWLRRTLRETKRFDHVFVFLHHPRWREDYHTNWGAVHDVLKKPGNVKAVFAGHIHRARYSGERDGIEYFALATTGGVKRHQLPRAGWLHHFDVVTVRQDGIQVAGIPVGEVVDPRSFTDDYLAELDRLIGGELLTCDTPITLDMDGSARGAVKVQLHNPTQRPIEVTVEIDSRHDGWFLYPDHHHSAIEPGDERTIEFSVHRLPGTPAERTPVLRYRTDYLGPVVRVEVPTRTLHVPVELRGVDVDAFAPVDVALRLHGSGACVRVPSKVASPDVGPFTIEGWVRADDLRGRRPILAKSENSEYYLFMSDGVPSFGVHLGGKYVEAKPTDVTAKTGRWYHLAGVYDGDEVRLYLDGQRVARTPARGRRKTNDHPLYVGADPNRRGQPVDSLRGWIDEVRLSSKARYTGSEFEPAARHEPDDATLLLLHLDVMVGPFTLDHSSRAAHPRCVNGARCEPRPTK